MDTTADDIFIFDAHCDTANVLLPRSDYFIKKNKAHLDLKKIRESGLNAQFFALWVNPVYSAFKPMEKVLALYYNLEKTLFSSGWAYKVNSTHEMESVLKNKSLACWLSVEGGHIIENSPENLDVFHSYGIRSMTLTHTKNTDWADSSGEAPRWDGLNRLGKKIVGKMEQIDMIIDISHASDKTVEDVLEITTKPIMASHSNARGICDVPRNLPDDFITEISERKGYIGINFFPGFLKKKIYEQITANLKKLEKDHNEIMTGSTNNPEAVNKIEMQLYQKMVKGISETDLTAVIDHIVYISDIGGIDCVGLGSDFDGIPMTPTDLTDVSCYQTLIEGLINEGFTRGDIQKIMGLNLLTYLKHFE